VFEDLCDYVLLVDVTIENQAINTGRYTNRQYI